MSIKFVLACWLIKKGNRVNFQEKGFQFVL